MKRKWKLFKRKRENNRGVTLIEAMVATVILALAVIPLMNSLVTAAKVNAKTRIQQERNTLGMSIMEQVKAETLRELYKKRLDVFYDDTVDSMEIAGHTVMGSDIHSGVSHTISNVWYGDKDYTIPSGNLSYSLIVTSYEMQFNNIDGYYVSIDAQIDKSNSDDPSVTSKVGYESYSEHGLAQFIQYNVTVSLYKTEADMLSNTNVVEKYTGTARDLAFLKYEDPN